MRRNRNGVVANGSGAPNICADIRLLRIVFVDFYGVEGNAIGRGNRVRRVLPNLWVNPTDTRKWRESG